jgi:hypothetical protein
MSTQSFESVSASNSSTTASSGDDIIDLEVGIATNV